MARTKTARVPEIGGDAPEFNLPSAQGGQLKLSMRTARGPVILVFYGSGVEEDVRYFGELAAREDEINMAGGTVVGIGISEPAAAREFLKKTGLKSYVLYDYARAATRDYGLLEKSRDRGEYARPAAFVIGGDHKVAHAWVDERPDAGELLAKISGITGLPRPDEPAEETKEKPAASEASGEPAAKAAPAKVAPEKAAPEQPATTGEAAAGEGEKPKKMSAEDRERIKAERRAARAEGQSLKQTEKPGGAAPGGEGGAEGGDNGEPQAAERKRLSPEEREKRRAERRAAREAEGTGEAAKDGGGEASEEG